MIGSAKKGQSKFKRLKYTSNMRKNTKAFTLIELLIVVAIIAILAAIAVPNFLEAQTRSKVSRAQADLRTIATALETYRVDSNAYPPLVNSMGTSKLTTPIAYISSLLRDPFAGKSFEGDYYYEPKLKENADYWAFYYNNPNYMWVLMSIGPNRIPDSYRPGGGPPGAGVYDATNGTISRGDIFRFGP